MIDPDEVGRIARGLTEEDRACLLNAKVTPPNPKVMVGGKPFMPDYYSVEISCNSTRSQTAVLNLETKGMWTLPIRLGDRSYTRAYCGQILPLGLAVLKYIMEQDND